MQSQNNLMKNKKTPDGFGSKYKYCNRHKIDTLSSPEKFTRILIKKRNSHEFKCRECWKLYDVRWRSKEENRLKKKKYKHQWDKINRTRINAYNREYENKRRKVDVNFKLRKNLRSRLNEVLRSKVKKSASTMELVGCSISYLRFHLEKKFEDGMNWDNYGVWHLDHIIPCARFDLSDPEQQKICFHYTNLQPIWGEHNVRKGSRLC